MRSNDCRAARGVSALQSEFGFRRNSWLWPGDCHEHLPDAARREHGLSAVEPWKSLHPFIEAWSVVVARGKALARDVDAEGHDESGGTRGSPPRRQFRNTVWLK